MANAYKNDITAVATTDITTVYTCPTETVALIKSISVYNVHASTAIDVTLSIYDKSGDVTKDYEKKAALAAVEPPVDAQLGQLGDHIEGFIGAWTMATKEERHQLITMMLDAVYVDMKTGEVVGVKPKPEFLPLFNLREPVKSGETILVTRGFEQS